MSNLRRFLLQPLLSVSTGQVAEAVLTATGLLGMVVGMTILPTLELTLTGFYGGLLGLVSFAVLCYCAGQLAILREMMERHAASGPISRQ